MAGRRAAGDGVLQLTQAEARGLMLSAQGLWDAPRHVAGIDDVYALTDRLGVVQIDTINVVERTQYLVLWSRLGTYDPTLLDQLLYPQRRVFEYWSHAASIVPMSEYRFYRHKMLNYAEHMWKGDREWMAGNEDTVRRTLEHVRERGPVASADFERSPDARRTGPWDWHGPKESRRALDILWTTGEVMVHSRRGGQKLYDVRERVLEQSLGSEIPSDAHLPGAEERLQHFVARTTRALGVVTPSWLWDYFRLALPAEGPRQKGAAALVELERLRDDGLVVPAAIEGLPEAAFVDVTQRPRLEQMRTGDGPARTTLLSPFDSLIWDRKRARQLFDYEVCFEAYVPPPKRRYGYYCLAILHRGRLVGRVDPKMDRAERRLLARAIYLEPGVEVSDDLVDGLSGALRDLALFLGATEVAVERAAPAELAPPLVERLAATPIAASDHRLVLQGQRRTSPHELDGADADA